MVRRSLLKMLGLGALLPWVGRAERWEDYSIYQGHMEIHWPREKSGQKTSLKSYYCRLTDDGTETAPLHGIRRS